MAQQRSRPEKPRRKTRSNAFAGRLLRWYDRHGRKDLPWKSGDPYHVWLSEIMLQQTQVATVIPYFTRFIARFPTIAALARADVDAVLHLWSGLGYYARARNLHRAAQVLVRDHGGRIPRDFEAVAALPGVGRSTAGAILALAYGERHAILDGNVKRVLARYHAIAEPLVGTAIEKRLWNLAEQHTPHERVAHYTQAIMDLGATICRRRQPLCTQCPVKASCAAYRQGNPDAYPKPAARKTLPRRLVRMLIIRDAAGRVLLQRRPPIGIWGGLWGLPECRARDVRAWCREALGLEIEPERPWPRLRHTFSHFHLDILPVPARLTDNRAGRVNGHARARAMEDLETVWYNCRQPNEVGLAAPVRRLLEQCATAERPTASEALRHAGSVGLPCEAGNRRSGSTPGAVKPGARRPL